MASRLSVESSSCHAGRLRAPYINRNTKYKLVQDATHRTNRRPHVLIGPSTIPPVAFDVCGGVAGEDWYYLYTCSLCTSGRSCKSHIGDAPRRTLSLVSDEINIIYPVELYAIRDMAAFRRAGGGDIINCELV